jgi:hypothetical protein
VKLSFNNALGMRDAGYRGMVSSGFHIEENINDVVENKDDTMIFALDLIQKRE